MILFMGPNEWASSVRCFTKLDVLLLLQKALMLFVSCRELPGNVSDLCLVAVGKS